MLPSLRVFFSLAIACLVAGAARGQDNKLPDVAKNILEKAGQLVLLSIDPRTEKEAPKDGFHGYKVLGRTTLKNDAQKKVVAALPKGMEGRIDPAKCFDPRHGISATHEGNSVELVICFECSQLYVHVTSEKGAKKLLIGKDPEPLLDKILKDAGIPRAK
jgi:hypothetical protein